MLPARARAFGPRRLGLTVVSLVLACHATALAADGGAARSARDEDRALAEDDDSTLNAGAIAALRRKRDAIHLGAPIVLLVAGSTVAVVSINVVLLRQLSAIGDRPMQSSGPVPAGWYVAGGVGASAALVGLIWLMDCGIRRGKIQDRIDKLSHPSGLDSLAVDARSGHLTISLIGHF